MDRPGPPFLGAEVVDVNIVVIPAHPVPQVSELPHRLASADLSRFISPPLTFSQVLNLEPSRGATPASQVESMRSQKSVTISNVRVEVHDLSGNWDFENNNLPETVVRLTQALGLTEISAVGANYEMTFNLPPGQSAAALIGDGLFARHDDWFPAGIQFVGGGGRLYLRRDEATTIVVAFEPRFNDVTTSTVWLTGSFQMVARQLPEIDALKGLFNQAYDTLVSVARKLFPTQTGASQ